MSKEEKKLGLTHVSVLRKQEPEDAHSKPGRRHKGLFVVAEWQSIFGKKHWYTVMSVRGMEKSNREAWKFYHDFHGTPGLSYEDAIRLAKDLREDAVSSS